MGRAEKRTKKNKYASKAPPIDPFEQTVAASQEYATAKQKLQEQRWKGKWAIEDEKEDEDDDDYEEGDDDDEGESVREEGANGAGSYGDEDHERSSEYDDGDEEGYDAEEEEAAEAAFAAEEEARWLEEQASGQAAASTGAKKGKSLESVGVPIGDPADGPAGGGGREAPRQNRAKKGEGKRKKKKRSREFPDESDIDPYDPTTFGFAHVGRVVGAHGLMGEVKVRVFTDFAADRLSKGQQVHVKEPSRRFPKPVSVIASRPVGADSSPASSASSSLPSKQRQEQRQQASMWLVRLKGVATREDAALLRNHDLFVWRTDRTQALDTDEYLVEDLVGLRVYRRLPPPAPATTQETTAPTTASTSEEREGLSDASSSSSSSASLDSGGERKGDKSGYAEGEEEEEDEEHPQHSEFMGTVVGVVTRDQVAPAGITNKGVPGGGGDGLKGHDLLEIILPPPSSRPTEEVPRSKDGVKQYLVSGLAPKPVLTCLVPLVPSIVVRIDLPKKPPLASPSDGSSSSSRRGRTGAAEARGWKAVGCVWVDPPEGLFEATVAEQHREKIRVKALLPPLAEGWLFLQVKNKEKQRQEREAEAEKTDANAWQKP